MTQFTFILLGVLLLMGSCGGQGIDKFPRNKNYGEYK